MSGPAFSVDVGNSSVGVVCWKEGAPRLARHAQPEEAAATLQGEVAVVSVAPQRLALLLAALPRAAHACVLDRPPVDLGPPGLLASAGADRVAAALALRPGPGVAIDAGTAATVDLVDASGRFHGGFIAPGPAAAAAGLARSAAQLPDLGGVVAPIEPGAETRAALSAGTWGLAVGGLDRLVEAALARLGGQGVRLVATGGWGDAWRRASRHARIEFDPLLVHRGILLWVASG